MMGVVDTPWLDVSATISWGNEREADEEGGADGTVLNGREGEGKKERYVCLAVTNVHEHKDFEVEMAVEGIKGKEVQVFKVGGGGLGPWTTNTWEKREEVGIREGVWKGEGEFVFERCSLTMLRWRA